ncbi:MAG: hypothetical protein AAF570_15650, partial [Bacteroidota bacterium]
LQSAMKTLLRAGFELVLLDEGRYTTDLYPCYTAFARHLPAHAADMRRALEIFLRPDAPDTQVSALLDRLIPWMVAQFHKMIG